MANFLWLSFSVNRSRALSRYLGFINLAQSLGHSISPIESGTPERSAPFESMYAQIRSADGYILSTPELIMTDRIGHSTQFVSEIQEGMQQRKRLLVIGTNMELNSLLLAFDMGITTDNIFMRRSPAGHERLLLLASKEQTYAWDSPLLKEVEDILVQQPNLLWYGKDAGPFLVCPTGAEIVDALTDRVKDVSPRELACAGVWPVHGEDAPRVLVLPGGVVHDAYQGAFGHSFPGIVHNRTFARNLIDWLANAEPHPTESRSNAATIVHAIEIGLHDIVTAMLHKEFGTKWWTAGVPKKIRVEASQRHEEEDGAAPKEAYLYLLHLKEIIEKQWPLFATLFEVPRKGKSNSLEWFIRLNEIRNRTAHPIKLRHRPLDLEELQFLGDRLRFVQDIAQKCGISVSVPE